MPTSTEFLIKAAQAQRVSTVLLSQKKLKLCCYRAYYRQTVYCPASDQLKDGKGKNLRPYSGPDLMFIKPIGIQICNISHITLFHQTTNFQIVGEVQRCPHSGVYMKVHYLRILRRCCVVLSKPFMFLTVLSTDLSCF